MDNQDLSTAMVQALQKGFTPQQIFQYLGQQKTGNPGTMPDNPQSSPNQPQNFSIFGNNETPEVTETFGEPQNIEVFSGGRTNGTGLGVKEGTPVALPPGEWEVMDSWAGDTNPGFIGDNVNSGYGNSALVRNTQTGEMLRYSHLKDNYAPQGATLPGGIPFGTVGQTGNATGPHLNLEYYDQNGNLGDVLQSPYSQYLGLPKGGQQ